VKRCQAGKDYLVFIIWIYCIKVILLKLKKMRIYLATWLLEESQGVSLTRKRYKQRLLSFFHTREKKDKFKPYIKTGQ